MENHSSVQKAQNESVAETAASDSSADADAVPAMRSERKRSVTDALYSPEAADIEFEIPKLGPILRPVDFGVVLD